MCIGITISNISPPGHKMPLVLSQMTSLHATVSLPLRHNPNRKKLTCAATLSPPPWKQSRRVISVSFFLSRLLLLSNDAIAGSLMDKYVKRKKLDPLEAYVPPVILAQLQIQDLEEFLNVEKPKFEACRRQLRSGPASSLRVNIRAVAQYASDDGFSKTATDDVDRCLRALEELDSLFLRASRKDSNATVELMKSQLGTALTALDSLLQTVPSQVLDKGKAMVEVYRSASEQEAGSDDLESSEIKQLQSIL
ncbi:hypothetical protein ISN44_As09g007480 [Arabidopsis suecica]|uniref:DUF7880 domain-containing protein n=1 Tax=Arabidopsis suecica TaxID=45249 RepID=A0A8T2AFR4_ARASU|nr:hypothetical protein ISN44_As09g007480 [Arabidopsis suecica]